MSYASPLESTDLDGAKPSGRSGPFEFWRALSERSEWVEEPNVRRKGVSGVRCARLNGQVFYIKTQSGHCHRSWRYPLGRPTALREAEALEACHRLGILAPQIVFCEARKQDGQYRTLLVTRSLDGFVDLETFLHEHGELASGDDRRRLLDRIAAVCARLHGARWQHSALYAKHLFVATRPEQSGQGTDFDVALIDLEKVRKRVSVTRASRHDMEQFRRHRANLSDQDWEYLLARYKDLLSNL